MSICSPDLVSAVFVCMALYRHSFLKSSDGVFGIFFVVVVILLSFFMTGELN